VSQDITLERRDTLGEETRAFIQSVQSNERPLVSGVEGRKALALARMVAENIEKGISGFVRMP
jgi:hypothetical protein